MRFDGCKEVGIAHEVQWVQGRRVEHDDGWRPSRPMSEKKVVMVGCACNRLRMRIN